MDAKMRKKSFHASSSSKKFGCRVRFPIYACSFVKKGREDEEDEYEREKKKEIRVVSMGFKEVKREEAEEEKRVDRMLLEPEFSDEKNGVGSSDSEQNTAKHSVSAEKKGEDQSLNLGMGVGLILLLSKSTTELNKMVELRKEMETILTDIKNEIKKKNEPTCSDNLNNAPVTISISEGNENTSNSSTPLRENGEFNIVDSKLDEGVNEIDEMEAELEVELERLQFSVESKNSLPPLRISQVEFNDSFSNSFEEYNNGTEQQLEEGKTDEEEEEEEEEERNNNNYEAGVCPFELERRLLEVLETRQRERIEELESALEFAERKLHDKEREICWWRDTAKLVTQHKDDPHFR